MLLLQVINGRVTKYLKAKEAVLSDERLKLVNDLVVGVRTIKCYAWENVYIQKIKDIRKK